MTTHSDEIDANTGERTIGKTFDIYDLAVWPDGSWATLGEVWNNDYAWMSDDFEMVHEDNTARLGDLGIPID